MKKIVLLVLTLIVSGLYGQKIKIKKNVVSIEKNEVCRLEKEGKTHYKLYNPEGDLVLNFDFLGELVETLQGEKAFRYLVFSQPGDENKYYSDYDLSGLKLSFSGDKTLIRHLIKKNRFLNEKAINYDKINAFFSEPRPKNELAAKKAAEFKQAYKAVEDFNLVFDKNKIFKKENGKDIFIGIYKVGKKNQGTFKATIINVYDSTNFLTSTYNSGLGYIRYFDGNKTKYRVDFGITGIDTDKNARKIVSRMIMDGYTLANTRETQSQAIQEKTMKRIALEKQNSNNIYDERAIIYDKQGNKVAEGIAELEFEQLKSVRSASITGIESDGGFVVLINTTPEGLIEYKSYTARKEYKVCIQSTGKCYQGIKTKGLITKPKFNLEIDISPAIGLYKSFYGYYIIKKKDKEQGLIVRTRQLLKGDVSKKMFENILEYLNDCPDLKDKLNGSKLNLEKEEDLRQIIDAYKNCN